MLEKVSHIAEQAATNVSRREFLGRVGRSAASSAAAVAGLLAFSDISFGGKQTQLCLPSSHQDCAAVGQACGDGLRGTCVSVDKKDKSDAVQCACRIKGNRGGRRR